jgi:hypothetical protein
MGVETTTFWLVAQCLSELRYNVLSQIEISV